MYPAVPVPRDARLRPSIDVTLKPGWRLEPGKRIFVSGTGETCRPSGELPKGTRIVPKVPALAKTPPGKLSEPERDLQRYVQVILPAGESASTHLKTVRAWDCVESASLPPEVSLPRASGFPGI